MKKRTLAFVLAAFMVLTAIVVAPVGADEISGDWQYTVLDGEATLTKYIGSDSSVSVPGNLDGYPVTTIGYWAFENCSSLTSVIIPAGVTLVGDYAFSECGALAIIEVDPDNTAYKSVDGILFTKDGSELIKCPSNTALTSVDIPDGVTAIRGGAFTGCATLTGVTIPDSVTTIGSNAFADCRLLSNVTIGDGVTTIESSAFENCTALMKLTIGNGVTTIGDYVFHNCTKLKSVTILSNVKKIGYEAFFNCVSLTSVFYGGSEEQWKTIDIDNTFKGNYPLLNAKIIFNSTGPAPGDLNSDGKLNSRDVIAIMKLILTSGTEITDVNDINGDGKLNSRDVIALMKLVLEQS